MPNTVFFSWQADTETKVGRNLIERALERAASRIGDDTNVEEAIRDLSVDRDTKDVPGSPPIVDTIFQKIDRAAVFVPDLTFVGHRLDGRPTPNPNVLIEYGWALKSLGHGCIVPVMNSAFGDPTQDAMPFNLRHLRNPIVYHCPPGADDEMRKEAREGLAREMERALRAVVGSKGTRSLATDPGPFPERSPGEGAGKFRKAGEPLGVHDDLRRQDSIFLSENPVIWFRAMPAKDPERTWLVSELKQLATANDTMLLPFNNRIWKGFGWVRGQDGFGIYGLSGVPGEKVEAIAFAFTTGEIWSIDSNLLDNMVHNGEKFIPDVENYFSSALDQYSNFLLKLGCKPPFRWIAGMEDLKNRDLYTHASLEWFRPKRNRKCLQEIMVAEGLHSPGDNARSSLKPFFTKLFDACGAEWSELKS
jgi:hypothetical protein